MRALFHLAAMVLVFQTTSLALAQMKTQANRPAWQTVLEAKAEQDSASGKRQYVLECKLSTAGKQLKDATVIADPRLIVSENQPAKIERLSQSPFVTGVTVVGDSNTDETALQPVITVLDEGYTLKVQVAAIDQTHVQLDASLTLQQISDVEEVALGRCTTQAPVHNTVTRRILRAVRLGERQQVKIAAAVKDESIVFAYTVKQVK